jgi:hypothetical protein
MSDNVLKRLTKPDLERRVALLDRVSKDEREPENLREAARLERERLARVLAAKKTAKRGAVVALVVLGLYFGGGLFAGRTQHVEAGQVPVYSVPCPQGSSPLPFGQTSDSSGKLVAFACVDAAGSVTLQPATVNGRTAVQQAGVPIVSSSGESTLTGFLTNNFSGTASVHAWVFSNAHTLTRLTVATDTVALTCSTLPQINVVDQTTVTTLATVTLATGAATIQADSGPLSVAMTAGHQFTVNISRAAACSVGTFNNPHVTVNYQ